MSEDPLGSRREMILELSPAFCTVFRKRLRFEIVESDIPDGVKCVDGCYDEKRGVLQVYLEHESFPLILLGQTVPHIKPPIFRQLNREAD